MSDKPIYLSYPYLKGNEMRYVTDCLESEWVSTSGTFVAQFEKAIADYVKAPSAVACVNGTAALHICLLVAGVQPGEEVLVPTLTFIAPVNAVRYVNAEPVFLDCDDYLNLDVHKLEQFLDEECDPAPQTSEMGDGRREMGNHTSPISNLQSPISKSEGGVIHRATGRRIRAIIPVHVFGSLCDMDRLMSVATKYRLIVIEDATEALGSSMKTGSLAGQHAGAVGDYGCYSFNGNKIITCGGGGMIVARDPQKSAKAKYLTTQAKDDELHYLHNEIGYNYRLTAIQAAMGLAQLEQLPEFIRRKKTRYFEYRDRITQIPGLRLLDVPDYCDSNYWFYSLVIDEARYGLSRDALLQKFEAARIQSRPIWKLNHTQKPYLKNQAYRVDKAPFYFDHVLNIPCSVGLTDAEVERVMGVLGRR